MAQVLKHESKSLVLKITPSNKANGATSCSGSVEKPKSASLRVSLERHLDK
jgi:hypothetical protein